jgi:osomolarity two-component system response regulator SSK1
MNWANANKQPVNFVWLERKVMEWGCMQALIDFDGWRKWKDFSQQTNGDADEATDKKKKKKRGRISAAPSTAGPS